MMNKGNKIKNTFVMIIIFFLSLTSFYQLSLSRIEQTESLTQNLLDSVIVSNANGISVGYFQWDDMFEAISDDDEAFIQYYKDEIHATFPFVDEITVLKKPYGGQHQYKIYTLNGNAYFEFGIWNNDYSTFIMDTVVQIEFNPQYIFTQITNNNAFDYEIQIGDNNSIEGILVVSIDPPLKLGHYISALSISLLSLFFIKTFHHFSVKSHYEIEGLAHIMLILSKKDAYTAEHSKQVSDLSVELSYAMGFKRKQRTMLSKAGHLHDIGKIGISEMVLNKPGKLLPEEFNEIKKHSEIGYEIVSQIPNLKEIALIVKHHHELLDGTGYPQGLIGDQIPLMSQILTVADVYCAMTTDRPYRLGLSEKEAISIMEGMSINQQLVAFLKERLHLN